MFQCRYIFLVNCNVALAQLVDESSDKSCMMACGGVLMDFVRACRWLPLFLKAEEQISYLLSA